jgi:hypothetical protein
MLKYLDGLLVQHLAMCRGPFMWQYNNAAFVGVVVRNVLDILAKKKRALEKYDRANTTQAWLLVCADVLTTHDSAGPREHAHQTLTTPEVLNAAHASGFDRVVFWSRLRAWHVDLWP